MSIKDSNFGETVEECPTCGRQTRHRVAIEIRKESEGKNSAFSREPYRVTRCQVCGVKSSLRMNNV